MHQIKWRWDDLLWVVA